MENSDNISTKSSQAASSHPGSTKPSREELQNRADWGILRFKMLEHPEEVAAYLDEIRQSRPDAKVLPENRK